MTENRPGPVRDEIQQAWMRLRPHVAVGGAHRQRGIALLMVLVIIAIMISYSVEFGYNGRVALRIGLNHEAEIQAYYHARSSIEIARMVIMGQELADQMLKLAASFNPAAKGQNLQMYRYACMFAEIFNTGKVSLLGLGEALDLSGRPGIGVRYGSFSCEVDDEDGRVNVNFVETEKAKQNLFKTLYMSLLGPNPDRLRDQEDDRAQEVLENMMDWVDSDEARTEVDPSSLGTGLVQIGQGAGGEGSEYDGDYDCKNAKFDTVEELHYVAGIDDEMYCRLRDKVTVYSTEKLNVNTASLDVIKAVACSAMPIEQQIISCGQPLPGLGPGLPLAVAGEMITAIDVAGELLQQCRDLKMALMTEPFRNSTAFVGFFSKLPPEIQPYIQVNGNMLRGMVGTRGKIIRVSGKGESDAGWGRIAEKRIDAVIDTRTGRYVYWHEN